MKCENCGHNNQPYETKCARCGQPLSGIVEPTDIDALYAPVSSAVGDEGKTALYVASEEKPQENNPAPASKTIVKPSSPVAAQTIVKKPTEVPPIVSEASKTIVKAVDPVVSEASKTIVKAVEPVVSEASKTVVKAVEPVVSEASKTVIKAIAQETPAKTIVREPIQEVPAAPTVIEPVQIETANKTVCQTIITCPYCGFYPVLSSSDVCPGCKKQLAQNQKKEEVKEETKENVPNTIDNIYQKTGETSVQDQQGTICRPFYLSDSEELAKTKKDSVAPSFKLTLLPEEGEEVSSTTQQFDNGKAILNRSNTEPDNMSITSKEQAEIKYENGSWYIENRSKAKSTYIVVERKVKLQPGDIIILGNRRFKFDV